MGRGCVTPAGRKRAGARRGTEAEGRQRRTTADGHNAIAIDGLQVQVQVQVLQRGQRAAGRKGSRRQHD